MEGSPSLPRTHNAAEHNQDCNCLQLEERSNNGISDSKRSESSDCLAAVDPAEFVSSLPKSVQKNVKALMNILVHQTKLRIKLREEILVLEHKYSEWQEPLYEKRRLILSNSLKLTEEDCDFFLEGVNDIPEVPEVESIEGSEDYVTGVPEFWCRALKNASLTDDMIQKHDEPILKHLIDVRARDSEENLMSFKLEFHFEPNDYFTNEVLFKKYDIERTPEEDDLLSIDGPPVIRCKGCTIDWKDGKNVTFKTINKEKSTKNHGTIRIVPRTVKNETFFNFFNPPEFNEVGGEVDECTEIILERDFEVGCFIRNVLIPRAVLFYTGQLSRDDRDKRKKDVSEEEFCFFQERHLKMNDETRDHMQ